MKKHESNKKTEKEILEIKDIYKDVLDNIFNGVWVANKDDVIFYTNTGMEKIAGIPSEQIVNSNVLEDFPESALKLFRPYYLKAKDTLTKIFYDAIPVVTPAGRQSYQSGWLIPRIKDGEYNGIICTVEDITERKEAEEKLRKSESRFRRLYDSNMIGVAYWDESGRILDANDAFLNIVGYTREDLQFGKVDWAKMTPPEYSYLDKKGINEIKEKGVCSPFEKEYIRKDNTRVPIIIGGASLEGEDNIGVTYLIDITERKQAEKDLRESEIKLKKLNEDLEKKVEERTRKIKESEEKYREAYEIADFYRDLFAHDINNILNNVLASSDLCLMYMNDPENQNKIKEMLNIYNDQIKRGVILISNVHKLSELEKSKISTESTEA